MNDFLSIFQWWSCFLIIGVIFLPFTLTLFSSFFDKGYIFAKVIGIAIISYTVFLLGTIKILPFSLLTIFFVLFFYAGINIGIQKKYFGLKFQKLSKKIVSIVIFEELLFFLTLCFWSYIRGFEPDIHGLEKYMDYGFINSILRTDYFPPKDMWFTPFSINYYYFGHLVTAVLTKTSLLPSNITYNLMLATIFAFTFTCSFSIGANLIYGFIQQRKQISNQPLKTAIICGTFTAFLTSFAGNLHTLYTFFKPYTNDKPVPFWELLFSPNTFPNGYWYPNATRFIYNTIHEFPMYSFVVSDLHGHVLDIPFVFLVLALLLSTIMKLQTTNGNLQIVNVRKNKKSEYLKKWHFFLPFFLISFFLAIMYMTNAWDGIIYGLLSFFIFSYFAFRTKNYMLYAFYFFLILVGFSIFSLPFSLHFKPFVSGIGILCAPESLTNLGKIGPFLLETNHCQKSPWWQMFILYGFFYFWVISFLVFLLKQKIFTFNIKINHWNFIKKSNLKIENLSTGDIFILLLTFLSTILIIIPEFIYAKDIYPAHYRANTMFKLVYQAFIMLSITSGYVIIRLSLYLKSSFFHRSFSIWKLCFVFIGMICLTLVLIYPYFAITSYYGNLQNYSGLDGTLYLKRQYPTDYDAITWLNKNIKGQPIILEAQGDSYTDFARISANTGLPTVLGWTVHEWLWRGTYDIPAPRIEEVKTLYETTNISIAKDYINRYHVSLIFLGDLERQKYTNLSEEKFKLLGKLIYQNGQTKIYQIHTTLPDKL